MNEKDFMDWLRGILITILIMSLIVGVVGGVVHYTGVWARQGCERLGDQIGYNTKRVSGGCYIEIRPNVWVAEYNVVSFLPLVDCEKE